ncbi:unnamed protein product (macronuclear) [Paramecium tetraurelia]|uniref:Protein kinase domain-containing protein n=1 Tax=Paramecium tetraurelia TaxID=5888 RepID=A0DKK5_PARTE|nr:uncharacterized protein GSPATT00017902001 [Paramecium tetraurelia]CAK83572.1 unnamed protein product [Paramecium tetraurelia]|eukprot:XP_001450969.1 hypothetical protein (macronuclear) [Paramecium tetraurelia strain d4-2]
MFVNQVIESPAKEFQQRRFILLKQIGQGIEGEVFEAKVENQSFYQTNVAIKLYKEFKEREEQLIDWILEYQKKDDGKQSFLVKIFERIMYNNQTYLVMELGQCSLKQFLDSKTLNYDEKVDICFQISKSIQFLHNNHYLHRDIKPENFIKFQNQFKLTDFGLTKQSKTIQQRLDSIVGTPQYQAPETKTEKYSQEIDIWSLGCTFYEIFQNEPFFKGKNHKEIEKQQKRFKENREKYLEEVNLDKIDNHWKILIIKMLNKPENRPNIKDVVDEIQNIYNQLPFGKNIFNYLNREDKFYTIYENQKEYTLVVYGIGTINQEFINWLRSHQHDNKIDIPLHTNIQVNHIIDNKGYLVMESLSIELQEYLYQKNNLSLQEKLLIILDISKSIQYLHQNNYCHTDIHLDQYFKVNNNWKLAKFHSISKYQPEQQPQTDFLELDAKQKDKFRLGCLFYQILQGSVLFGSRSLQANQKRQIQSDISNYLNQKEQILNKIKQIQFEQLILPMLQSIDESNSSIDLNQVIKFIQDYLNNYQQQVNSIFDAPTGQFPKRYFVLSKLIGDGGEGAVYQAKAVNETFYSTEVALKIQQKMKDQELQFIDYLIDYQKNKEQTAFQKSNLIRVYERFEYQKQQVLIMELGIKDMNSVLKTNRIPQQQKEQICQQIAQSIAFLHKLGLIHRDIKPENFIQVGSIYKLIDFGLVKHGEQNLRKTKMVGSPQYQAPEIINGSDDYTASVDIWSLGCLFFEIFKQSPLFNGSSIREIQQSIFNYCQNQQQVRFEIQQLQIREELKNLLSQMIDPIPHKRPNIDSVQKQLQLKFPQSINLVQSTTPYQ